MAGWHSAVDKVLAVSLRAQKKRWWKIPALLSKLRRQLRAEHYNIVLDAQGLLKSALVSRLAGSAVYGFAAGSARESSASWLYDKKAKVPNGLHVIEKNRLLLATFFAYDISQPADFGLDKFRRQQLQSELSGALKDTTAQPYLLLLHGTTWNSKYWPETYWEELIRLLVQQGWRCLLPWGNDEEYQRALRLKAAGGEHAPVLPKLSLTELVSVVMRARAFVSVETGLGHLAAALGVPGIMLHGPTDPGYSGIPGKACRHITSGIYCSPCFRRDCPRIQSAQEVPPCQQKILPQQIYQECLALIGSSAEGSVT